MFDIIIVTYNAKDKLKRCLIALEKHTKSLGYLLTVINNNSTDGTPLFLKNYQQKNRNVNIINTDKNLGFSGGANIGLKNTFNEFIVLLDDDAEATKGWLSGLYKHIRNKPEIGIVGCRIVFPNNRIHSADYRVTPRPLVGTGEIDRGQRDYVKECDALIGSCWLMRRELIKNIGYFDERFFPCRHEDVDYCLRTRLAGYKIVYNGDVRIIHHNLFRDGGRKQNIKNQQRFLKKWKNLFNRFPLKSSHPVDKYIARGIKCLKEKKFKLSLIEFKKAESFDKRFSEPLYMGIALKSMGKYNDAIQQFKKVLTLNPSNSLAHFYMGIALKKIGNYRRAVQKFKKVISMDTSNSLVHYHLALIYKQLGLIKEAKREAKKTCGFLSSHKNMLI